MFHERDMLLLYSEPASIHGEERYFLRHIFGNKKRRSEDIFEYGGTDNPSSSEIERCKFFLYFINKKKTKFPV